MEENINTIWCERYRPATLNDYIGNEQVIEKVKSYIENEDIPHLLLFGPAGSGKTSLGKILINSLDCDYMYINASDENNVETIRTKIKNFASTLGFKKWKVVFLDEGDFITPQGQAALRNLMETYSEKTRFIITCNYIEKMLDPIQSRCQIYNIIPPSKKDVAMRAHHILTQENIKYNPVDLKVIIDSTYPDIRKIINECQKNSINGELKLNKQNIIESNYALKIIDILKDRKKTAKDSLTEIRQLLADSQVKDYTPLYQLLYEHVDDYSNGNTAEIILKITQYEYEAGFRVIKELSAASLIISILELCK